MEETLWAGTQRLVFSLTLFILLKVITANTSSFRGESCVCVYIWVQGYVYLWLDVHAFIFWSIFFVESARKNGSCFLILKIHLLPWVLSGKLGAGSYVLKKKGFSVVGNRALKNPQKIPLGERGNQGWIWEAVSVQHKVDPSSEKEPDTSSRQFDATSPCRHDSQRGHFLGKYVCEAILSREDKHACFLGKFNAVLQVHSQLFK